MTYFGKSVVTSFHFDTPEEAESVIKEAFWLAFEASAPMGLGHLHFREGTSKEEVWKLVKWKDGLKSFSGDYLQGRMVKLHLTQEGASIKVGGGLPRIDYQSWAGKYPTNDALIEAAIQNAIPDLQESISA